MEWLAAQAGRFLRHVRCTLIQRRIKNVEVCGDQMKVFVPFSLEEKGTKENIRNRQRTSREDLARKERGFIEERWWRLSANPIVDETAKPGWNG